LSGSLLIKNRQREIRLNTALLRTLTLTLLHDLLGLETFDLGICIVRAPEMARLNESFLHHGGSTDVITFDYSESPEPGTRASTADRRHLHGEIFICIDDAIAQARQFRTSWQSELARYVIHGVLHLRGFDDIRPADRRKMKRRESRLLAKAGHLFPLRKLAVPPRLAP
jgi:probable rRNA maturation factor